MNTPDPIEEAPVPPGCEPAPGYIIEIEGDQLWLTQDGRITDVWRERGVWPTPEAAAAAQEQFGKD